MRVVPLGDVVDFSTGGTPSRLKQEFWQGSIPWITGADIANDGAVSARSFISDAAVSGSSTKVLPEGTVILLTRTSVGKVAVLPVAMAINQDITGLTPKEELDTRYLIHFLRAQKPTLLMNVRGATIQGVTRSDVASLRLPLPPLQAQRRIAKILDRSDALRAKRRRVLAHLEALPQMIFHDMFGEVARLSQLGPLIASGPTNGLYRPASDYGSGVPILRIDGFLSGATISGSAGWKRLRVDDDDVRRYALRAGDLVINRVNALSHLGKSALVKTVSEPTVFESNMMRIRLDVDRVSQEYVLAWLQTKRTKQQILRKAKKAINQASINQTDLKSLILPLPPLELQHLFASRVEVVNAKCAVQQRALVADDELFASLQSRAFRGEL